MPLVNLVDRIFCIGVLTYVVTNWDIGESTLIVAEKKFTGEI